MGHKIVNYTVNEFWSGWDFASLLAAGAVVVFGLGFIFIIFILSKELRRNQWLKTFQHWIKNTQWTRELKSHKSCPKADKRTKAISNTRSIVESTAFRAPPKRSTSSTTTTTSIQPDSSISSVSSNTCKLHGRNRTARRNYLCENCSGK
ncbi:uncharacterized protein LOC110833363 [Zootermopsis nevadensis]|uniref:Uncharacterized protein n=1 Tax=Zootermopsis nevadensis TaxID=136037 RepID=A0A067RIU3_ZOONE|nr:uncharacterized protein LOC110833363 [Zootermopsis nevadensis]KDR23781.1 hypothetical protein L798_11355 [Zootermopsis nevadensis]